jgi:hypothetical protein
MRATVWAYPWDLPEEGVARAADCVAGFGLDGIRMASAYHSGKFLSPRSAHRRVEISREDPELWALVGQLVETVTAPIADIAALVHTRGKELFCFAPVFVQAAPLDWVEGAQARRLAPLVDGWELALYSPDRPERVARAQRAASLGLPCSLGAGINAGAACTRDAADLIYAALAAQAFRS